MVIFSFLLGINHVLLLEQLIYEEAKNNIIPKYPEISDDPNKEGKLRANYLKALETLSPATLEKDLGTLKLFGNSANPTKRPYTPDNGVHLTPKGYATIRHPDPNYVPK
ncbi:22838_t:CDS:2 [Gigaspora margarita]|uniref:22838_t:CDS:1 n=1 Tax=Gigaspora margarita TaxID=4874 RepID=A0ABN7UVX9_GIGMA|nr:22838_t:CDS:2 [Gigaspora margarita]